MQFRAKSGPPTTRLHANAAGFPASMESTRARVKTPTNTQKRRRAEMVLFVDPCIYDVRGMAFFPFCPFALASSSLIADVKGFPLVFEGSQRGIDFRMATLVSERFFKLGETKRRKIRFFFEKSGACLQLK